jgi:16S rRNA (cytosine967-C5)-methyltransferase
MNDKPREQALLILCRVEEGSFADPLLDQARPLFDVRDNAFILELVNGVLRHRAHLDWAIGRFSAQPISKTDIRTRNILRLGAYQMLHLDRVPVSAAVNTSVELAKKRGGKSGYVNALLRNLDRNRRIMTEAPAGDAATRLSTLYSHPDWLVRRWINRFGLERTEVVLRENNRQAPLVIRTNVLRTAREQLKTSLEAEGASVVPTLFSPLGLEISASSGLRSLSAYRTGWFMVQDQAAQLIAMMLDPQPGEEVLDACAAPGGKATHLAELMQDKGVMVALDSEAGRLEKVRENRDRLGAMIVRPVLGDATRYSEGKYDKILVDAPCSGLGVLRRHPDGRWNKREETIARHAALQRRILQHCASLLKPDGALVYATCTTEPEENEEVVAGFLEQARGEFRIDDPRPFLPDSARTLVDEQLFFRTFPAQPSMDGFFGARLKHLA